MSSIHKKVTCFRQSLESRSNLSELMNLPKKYREDLDSGKAVILDNVDTHPKFYLGFGYFTTSLKSVLFLSLIMTTLAILFTSNSMALDPGTINPGPGNYYTNGIYTGCTANDMTVTGWSFTSTSCAGCSGDSGNTGSGILHAIVTATAQTRYNVFLIFNVNGNPYRVLVAPILSGSQELNIPVTWTCVDQTKVIIGGPGRCGSDGLGGPIVRYDNDDLRKKYCDPYGNCGVISENDVNSYEIADVYDAGPKCMCLGSQEILIFASIASYTQPCNLNTDGTKTITFTQTASGGSGSYLYSWDWNNDGIYDIIDSTSKTLTHNLAPGTYTVGYKTKDSTGCTYTRTIQIKVYDNLGATVAYTQPCALNTDGTKTITFTSTASGGAGSYQYSWDWNNDGTYDIIDSTSNTVTHNFPPGGPYTVKWMVKDIAGCTKSETTPVTVYSAIAATVAYTQPCALNTDGTKTITFTSTASGGAGSYLYSWDWNNDGTYDISDSISNTATNNFATGGPYTVKYMVKDAAGCTNIGTTSVTVNTRLSALVSYTQPCTLNTDGTKTITFTSTASGGVGSYLYSWDWNNDGTYDIIDSTSNTVTYNFAPGGPYTIKWMVKDAAGCSETGMMAVIVQDKPRVTALTSDQVICINQPVQLTGTAINYGSVAWSITNGGPGALSPIDETTTTFTPTAVPGSLFSRTEVTFTAYGIGSCSALSDSKSLIITAYQLPQISIEVFPI